MAATHFLQDLSSRHVAGALDALVQPFPRQHPESSREEMDGLQKWRREEGRKGAFVKAQADMWIAKVIKPLACKIHCFCVKFTPFVQKEDAFFVVFYLTVLFKGPSPAQSMAPAHWEGGKGCVQPLIYFFCPSRARTTACNVQSLKAGIWELEDLRGPCWFSAHYY